MIPHTPETILVIDDDPRLLRVLVQLLRRDGYTVATAGNGRHALAQLQAQRYDVILSDLSMPEMDGRAGHDPNFRPTCETRGEPDVKTQRS
jgi:CheY-like chemotaxis protein